MIASKVDDLNCNGTKCSKRDYTCLGLDMNTIGISIAACMGSANI